MCLFALLLPLATFAAPIPISRCPTVITQAGDYVVTQDLQCATYDQIAITVQNTRMVNLNLGGRRIRGVQKQGWGGYSAIKIDKSSDVTINGTGARIEEFTDGIDAFTSRNITIGASIQNPFIVNAKSIGIKVFSGSVVGVVNVVMPFPDSQGLYVANTDQFQASNVNVNTQTDPSKIGGTGINFSNVTNSSVTNMSIGSAMKPIDVQTGDNVKIRYVRINGQSQQAIHTHLTKNYTFENVQIAKATMPLVLSFDNPGLVMKDVTWGTGFLPGKQICYVGTNPPPVPTLVNTAAPSNPMQKCW